MLGKLHYLCPNDRPGSQHRLDSDQRVESNDNDAIFPASHTQIVLEHKGFYCAGTFQTNNNISSLLLH